MNRFEELGPERREWSNEDLVLLALVVRIMEMDPGLERVEGAFRKGAELVGRLRAGREEEEERPSA